MVPKLTTSQRPHGDRHKEWHRAPLAFSGGQMCWESSLSVSMPACEFLLPQLCGQTPNHIPHTHTHSLGKHDIPCGLVPRAAQGVPDPGVL